MKLTQNGLFEAFKFAWDSGFKEGRWSGKKPEIKDEYHTMEEVYRHRNLLFINLCLLVPEECVWKIDHEKDWFLLYLKTNDGQVSYHIPRYYLPLVEKQIRRDDSFKWDGTDSNGVLNILAKPMVFVD